MCILLDIAKFVFIVIFSLCTLRNTIKKSVSLEFVEIVYSQAFEYCFFKFKKLYLYSLVLIWISFIMLKYILYIKDNFYTISYKLFRDFSAVSVVKNESLCQCRRHRFDSWVGRILWRRKWQPTPVFLLGKMLRTEESGGLQSMSCKELDMTEWQNMHACIKYLFLSFTIIFGFTLFFFSSGFRNSLCVRKLMTLFTIYIANVDSFFIICLLNLPIIFCHEKYFK